MGGARTKMMGPITKIPNKIKRRLMTSHVNLKKVLAGSAAANYWPPQPKGLKISKWSLVYVLPQIQQN